MDKGYWDSYYKSHGNDYSITKHSSFAKFCLDEFFLEQKLNIVELGSGNGRDAIYFAYHNHTVIAIDQSIDALESEITRISDKSTSNLTPVAENFIQCDFSFERAIDVFYSRFTIHAIEKDDENILLPKVYNSLGSGGLFCVEVRSIKDSLYGKGELCGEHTYLTDHRRRFIDSKQFLETVLSLGFRLLYFNEKNNLSVYEDDNPVLIRIILQKE